jgi:hypothetical protein
MGQGDYTVTKNSVIQKAASGIPMMHNAGQSVVVRHKEFVCSLTGSSDFSVQYGFRLNPGLSTSFPWLSQIACNFQEYSFKGLVFHYIPTSGSATGSNTSLGTVMMQTTYRATDSAPTSKVEIMNEYWANEVVPSETMVHPIECDPKENPFAIQYVRSGNVPSGDNQLLYDLGTTYIATSGQQGTNIIGDVYCTYEVELKKPICNSNVTDNADYLDVVYSTGVTTSVLFPSVYDRRLGNLQVSLSGRTIAFTRGATGTYRIRVHFFGNFTGASMNNWNLSPTLTNCSSAIVPVTPDTGANPVADIWNSGSVGAGMDYAINVTVTDPAAVASVGIPQLTGTLSGTQACSVFIYFLSDV